MTDTQLLQGVALVRPQSQILNIVALATAGVVTLGGLVALAFKIPVGDIVAICGPVVGGCLAIFQRQSA